MMGQMVLFALMYVAVGAGLFAQPEPGTAVPNDFAWRRQAQIFWHTLPAVLTWPLVLLRRFGC
jgi:hypothetical protein